MLTISSGFIELGLSPGPNLKPGLSSVQEEDFSIQWGDNVFENLPYNFSGTFYESTDYTFDYTNAKLETMYIPDNSVYYNDTITDSFVNYETHYPSNTSFTMVNGTHYQNGTLQSLDNDYAIFNSTTTTTFVPEQPTNFTMINGTSSFEGDLNFVDANYTMFNSTEQGFYNGTYSWTDDTIGSFPADWTDGDTGTCETTVIAEHDRHTKVLDFDDDDASGYAYIWQDWDSILYGTMEWWMMTTNINYEFYFIFIGDNQQYFVGFRNGDIMVQSNTGYVTIDATPNNNQWYHLRVDFRCTGAPPYMGLTEHYAHVYLDGVHYGDYNFYSSRTEPMKKMMIRTDQADPNYHAYLDGVGYSWDPFYEIGDNKYPYNLLNFTVDLNLDDFSSLEDLNLIYSYRTNTSELCNISIYDFDNTEYDLIDSAINLTFQNGVFGLNSSYYNATNDVILKFEITNFTLDYRLELDQLIIRHPAYLNFSTNVTFTTLINLLQFDINSYQRCNISQLINMSVWNWTSSIWVNLNSSSFTTIQLLDYMNNTDFFTHFIHSNGSIFINYYGVNATSTFSFFLDMLEVILWRKTTLTFERTFFLLGTWKYRFHIDIGLGSSHITDWIYFDVVEQQPNFEGISESRYSTKWVLTSTATTGTLGLVYEDDLTSGYWDLSDYGSRTFTSTQTATEDAKVEQERPDQNTGSADKGYFGRKYDSGWIETYRKYFEFGNDPVDYYLSENITGNYEFSFFVGAPIYYYSNPNWYTDVCPTSDFNEMTITWNTKPALGYRLVNDYDLGAGGSISVDLGTDSYANVHYIAIQEDFTGGTTTNGEVNWRLVMMREYYSASKRPRLSLDISKHYHTTGGEGYAYMQTDSTETLGLKSSQLSSDISLGEGDIFTIDLQTTSSNALLKLYNDDVLQSTFNLLTANTETARQEVEVYISEDVTYDQVKIISELDDMEYFKLYDIKAEHWTFTAGEESDSMYVEPFGQNELIISNIGNTSLKIYENDILQTDTYITLSYDLLTHVYESPLPETVFVSFYDSNNDYLDFNKFTTYVNYTLYEVDYIDQRLTNREFYVDEATNIYFNVYDSFDVNIYSSSRLAKTFIDISLNIYTLKIKNEAIEDASYTLTKGIVDKTGILFPDEIDEYMVASGSYTFKYIKGDDAEETVDFTLSGDKLLKINRSKICFLTYADQQGNHLVFENFKTYLNGSLIYENIFYEEIGEDVNITIKDRYNIQIHSEIYTVVSTDNYIPITLTLYSLKIYNQQEIFNWINITRDPDYYESSMYWSEWVAPSEIIEFKLFAGYYKINLTNEEQSSYSYYSYTLNGDDVILISSGNIISNMITNILNVNTTIGNQITNVQIDLTNQNSAINNSIINIDINISNLNSSLGNLLTTISLNISNINNNISNLYTFTENNFINLGTNINNSFISIENNIISINQSISNLVIGISNDIYLINGTISTMITQVSNNLLLMNTSIHTLLFGLDTDISVIGSDIANNFILLNNSIDLANNNINDSRIAIINNLALINNTISTLISQVYSSVYLINNSIFTAVLDLGTSLSLINNSISGDLTIMLQQNDFLTKLYQTTMFSELLNWTNIGSNASLIESQIDAWEFINNYKDQSIDIYLRYGDLIDNLTITAQNSIEQYLPNENVEYRLYSIDNAEYLTDWEELPENRTVSFGFFEEDIPYDPEPLQNTFFTYLVAIIFFVALSLGALKLYYSARNSKNPIPPELLRYMNKKSKRKIEGAVDDRL